MSIVSTLIALPLLAYLLIAKRTLDLFLVAGVSTILFFSPLFWGYIYGPPGYPVLEITFEVHITFWLLTFSLLVATYAHDRASVNNSRQLPVTYRPSATLCYVALLSWLSSLFLAVYLIGFDLLLHSSKRELMDSVGRELIYFETSTVIASLLLFLRGGFFYRSVSLLILALTIVIGFRTPLALTSISFLLIYGKSTPRISVLRKYPATTAILFPLGVVALILAKTFYVTLKTETGLTTFFEVMQEESTSEFLLRGAEFAKTQYSFNQIVLDGFSTDGGHIIRAPLGLVPFPRSWFTTPSSEFNDLYQTALFSDVKSGLAYNPFGEFYAAAGMYGVFISVAIYVFSVFILNRRLAFAKNNAFTALLAIISALLAFYIHRNSAATFFSFTRNFFYIFIGTWMAAQFVGTLTHSLISIGHTSNKG